MDHKIKPIRILFAEDLPTDVELAKREILKGGIDFTCRVVDTESEFKKELDEFNPDIVVSDYSMPNFDGMSALKITRSQSRYYPFIILTGSMNEETAVACMKAGANDYVIKEQIKRLPFAIKEVIEKQRASLEKIQIENQLRENEKIYSSLIENSSDAIYLLNGNRFEIVNSEFVRMFGYTFEELNQPDFDFFDLIAPESKHIIEEINRKALEPEKVSSRYEFSAISKSGEKKEVEASISFITFKGMPATQGIIRDITERIRTEEKMQYQSDLRNLLMELSSSFINVPLNQIDEAITKSLSKIGKFVKADRTYIFDYDFDNQVCSNTFEWCSKDISPQKNHLQEIPLSEGLNWVDAHINGKIVNIQNVSGLLDDSLRNLLEKQNIKSLLSIPLMKESRCIGFVGFDSIHEQHNYSKDEQQLLKVYSEMLVNSSDRQTREKELIQAKERAEESDRLKSAFLANMSHEIRTPMNGIMGFTELLKEPQLNGKVKKNYLRIIQKSGERMLNTINDLIEISKIESETLDIKYEEFNVAEQLNFLYRFFQPETVKKGLKLIVDQNTVSSREIIKTDKEKLNSILANLLKNAIKYTNDGIIEFGYKSAKNGIEFYVKDSGIGIKEDHQKIVFDRFIQADMSLSKPYEGAGLGLSIAKAYVDMLGGKIWLESEFGKGSNFYFSIPRLNN